MSLTLNTYPANVVNNSPVYNVTTSLVEGSAFNNVRIRANVYVDGVIKAVLEQPKGLPLFDFFNVLKAFCGRLNQPPHTVNPLTAPSLTSELLTGWTNENYGSGFQTFTTSGREITTAISDGAAIARSNNLGALSVGDIIIVGSEHDYIVNTGSAQPYMRLSDGTNIIETYTYSTAYGITANKIRMFMVTQAMSASYIEIGHGTGSLSFAGTWTIKRIAGDACQIGKQCSYYKIGFQEFYEDADGITVEGTETRTNTLLFVPAVLAGGETLIANYIMNSGSGMKFLHDSIRNATWFKLGIGMDVRILFVSDETYIALFGDIGTGEFTLSSDFLNCGYGFACFTDTEMATITSYLDFKMKALRNTSYSAMSETLRLNMLTKCYYDIKTVEFVGNKGLEVLMFKGQKTSRGVVQKESYQTISKVNMPYLSVRKREMVLRSLYENPYFIDLLCQLINNTQEAWLFSTVSPYKSVIGVTSDEVLEYDQGRLIENSITIEYYE